MLLLNTTDEIRFCWALLQDFISLCMDFAPLRGYSSLWWSRISSYLWVLSCAALYWVVERGPLTLWKSPCRDPCPKCMEQKVPPQAIIRSVGAGAETVPDPFLLHSFHIHWHDSSPGIFLSFLSAGPHCKQWNSLWLPPLKFAASHPSPVTADGCTKSWWRLIYVPIYLLMHKS